MVGIDDQTADSPEADPLASSEAIAKAWDNPATAKRKRLDKTFQGKLSNPDAVMGLYRAINDLSQAKLIFMSDMGAALEEPSPQQYGRAYVAYWETRNLRIAANFREAMGKVPGCRTLVIVGSSHKWYLEAYLNQMHDLRIVSTDQVLY